MREAINLKAETSTNYKNKSCATTTTHHVCQISRTRREHQSGTHGDLSSRLGGGGAELVESTPLLGPLDTLTFWRASKPVLSETSLEHNKPDTAQTLKQKRHTQKTQRV